MISAIVLAAGKATRFGQCKQLMPLFGKSLLQHALDSLRQSKIDEVVVVLGDHADAIRREVRFEGERVVLNPDFAEGMSTSIQAGLRAISSHADAAMIVLGDQPLVTSVTLDRLIDEYRRARPSVALPTYNGFRGNPVIVDRALFAAMMEIRGDIGCRAVFGDHAGSILKVPVDDRGVVTDIDTMEDLGRVMIEGEGSGKGGSDGTNRTDRTDGTDGETGLDKSHRTSPMSPIGPIGPGTPSTPLTPASSHSLDLLETIVDLRRRRQPFAMATVVRAERPTSSKPGDKAIISPDGTLTGWIGGSCAHDIVVRNALESLEEGAPRFLTLSGAAPAGVQRLGVIDIPMQCYSGGVLDVFIEPNLPRPHLVVVGYETIAQALVRIGKTLQFHVTVVDPLATRAAVPDADDVVNELLLSALPLGSESFIVIATHGRYDEEALEQAAHTDASYIALVSSPRRGRVILELLEDRGLPEEALSRIKSPAGLDIGAQGAEEIALSIVAEIVRERRAVKMERPPQSAGQPVEAEPAEAIDPICNMTVTIADARYTAEHDGKRYYFCCAHCQRTFEKDPQRYAHVA
jgi:xanthine dehydrogenase accessory factor